MFIILYETRGGGRGEGGMCVGGVLLTSSLKKLAQFRDYYDNWHKSEALVTNKPWTIYTSTSRLL